jgi:signal transduction histidine kinase
MTLPQLNPFEILKASTLGLLAILLFSLGSATHPTSLAAYLAFGAIMMLQAVEMFAPVFSERASDLVKRTYLIRLSIFVQLLLAAILVAVTDGSGSIYELVYLLPIVSAATKLPGRDVVYVVGGSTISIIGFILTGEQLTASITRVKEFQDAVAAIVYFTMTGLLVFVFAKGGREQKERYQNLATALSQRNEELKQAQTQLTERLNHVTKMEERLQQISQMAALGEMAGQVAHEVRNPLGIIKGSVELLAARVTDPATQRHIAVVLEETTRLNKAVEGVLRLGAPLRMRQEQIQLPDLLESVTQVSKAWSSSRLSVTLTGSGTAVVCGDYDLLHQAFLNLVRNAFQSMPSGGSVTIKRELSEDGGSVTLAVSDHGVGLATEDLKRLGEPFFTRRSGGIGLGFALVRRVILEHGGSLSVASTLGQGTTVTIRLPLVSITPEHVHASCGTGYAGLENS